MAIGTVPPNTTKATALQIVFYDPIAGTGITAGPGEAVFRKENIGLPYGDVVWNFNQGTSYWPYGDQFPPPDEPNPPAPIYTELWYKFTAGPSLATANVLRGMYGLTVWNAGGNGTVNVPPYNTPIYPGYSYSSGLTVYKEDDSVVITGRRVQFYAGDPQESAYGTSFVQYYIKIVTPVRNDIPLCNIKLHFYPETGAGRFTRDSIMIQDEDVDKPIAAMKAGPRFHQFVGIAKSVYDSNGVIVPNSFSSYGGGAGDVLPNGHTCIMNVALGGVSYWDKYYDRNAYSTEFISGTLPPLVIPTGTVYVIRRNGDGTNFWISYRAPDTNVPTVRSITWTHTTSLVLGTPVSIPDVVSRLCARGNEVLYYNLENSYVVSRWNLITDTPLPDLAAAPSPIIGVINDIAVLANGNVLITYASDTSITVRRVDGITGNLLMEYKFPTVDMGGTRAVYGSDPTVFWIRTHEVLNTSTYRSIRLSDGIILNTIFTQDFIHGVLINDWILYNADDTIFMHPQLFGGSGRWNFWISPVAGVSPTGPPPDDEFYPPIVYPPYPFPPPEYPPGGGGEVTPPPIPPPQIGGGLVVLDPANVTRHDVYLDASGQPIKSTIISTIRTAFLGD